MNNTQRIAGILILVFGILALLHFGGYLPIAPQENPVQEPIAEIYDGNILKARIYLEVADTPEEREQGLMNRSFLASDQGMLFVFEKPARYSFWMKNTLIPLDIVFISPDHIIVDIITNTTPFNTTHLTATTACQYAIEVNAGYCTMHGIMKGNRVRFAI